VSAAQTLLRLGAAALALGFFALGLPLGRGLAAALDRGSLARAEAAPALTWAIAFTRSGYWPALCVLSALAAGAAIVTRAPLAPVLWVVALQLVTQSAVALAKTLFSRARPSDWLNRREAGYSYPSGHAATAVDFYGGWACVLILSNAPVALKTAGSVALLAWAAGICWSRVRLRAHYPSDVAGGLLAGGAFLCSALALAARLHLRGV
jgi:undecaprenyl-diphosphatase